ncbi:MAG: choice-of-anchor Q domain-containing protein [Chloroflexota bacterium]
MSRSVGLRQALVCAVCLWLSACGTPNPTIACSEAALVSAINDANSNPDHTTIIMDEGCLINMTTAHSQMDHQEAESGLDGFTGMPAIYTPITIQGNDSTIQRLVSAPEMRFFYIQSIGELTLEGLTLNNGLVQTGNGGYRGGGAIYNRGVFHIISGGIFESYAADSGGGIINVDIGSVHIDNSSVSSNTAGVHGGAILNTGELIIDGYSIINNNQAAGNGGAIMTSGALTIDVAHISNNQTIGQGGAISTNSGAYIELKEVLFEGNQTGISGGGAILFSDSVFSIHDCTFSQNQTTEDSASGGAIKISDSIGLIGSSTFISNYSQRYGGGVNIAGDSDLTIASSTFQNNSAAVGGGGLSNSTFGWAVEVTDTTFSGNDAAIGGAISTGGELTVRKSLISGNTSTESGGGIHNGGTLKLINSTVSGNTSQVIGGGLLNYGTIQIVFSTIAYNQAIHGGGLYGNQDLVEIKNSIFSGNTPDGCSVAGPLTAYGANLDDDGSCQGFNLTINPFLGPLAANGGSTMTHAFTFFSEAVDGANDCTDIPGTPAVNQDQRFEPRPFNGICDLGAYEAQVTPPAFQANIQVGLGELPCLEGPHENFAQVTSFLSGESLTALGRNEAATWLGIAGMNGKANEVVCWVPSTGVESLILFAGYPVLSSAAHPPESGMEEANGFNRCALFAPETYSLSQLDIPYGTGKFTIVLTMPEGVHGLEVIYPEDLEPWIYSVVVGQHDDPECTFDGYAGKLYCRLEIPESYFGTVRPVKYFVNGCEDPFYVHNLVTIIEPAVPISCSISLGESDCIAAGGSYSCGASSDCECICP